MTTTRITLDEVRHVARLARLGLDDAELTRLRGELDALLEHFASLSAVDVAGVTPTGSPVPLDAPLRPDEPGASLSREDALASAPRAVDGAFAVPRVHGVAP